MKVEQSRRGQKVNDREQKKSISQPRQDNEEDEADEEEADAQRRKKRQLEQAVSWYWIIWGGY